MGDVLLGALARGISVSIAVTSTTVAGHRHKNKIQAQDTLKSPSVLAPSSETTEVDGDHPPPPPTYNDVQDVHVEWALDEAGERSGESEPDSPSVKHRSGQIIAEDFLSSHRTNFIMEVTYRPLPELVLLPQRRPKARSRGFVRAYAESLGRCSGIDQDTFIDFIESFDRSTRAAPIFNIINMACFGASFAGHIGLAVASAVQVVNGAAKSIHTKLKTNKFLNEMNEKLFKPRGLYVLIMAYQPDKENEPLLQADSTDDVTKAVTKCLSAESSVLKAKLMMLKSTAGTTKHDQNIPPCAQLVYPPLDRSLDLAKTNSNGPLKLTKSMMDEYLDRRAQAKCVAEHKDSSIAKALPPPPPPSPLSSSKQTEFVNRYCDPDHKVNSGSIFGIVTGGTFDPIAKGRVRKAKETARKNGEPELTEEEMHNAYMGRGVRGRKGIHDRKRYTRTDNILQKDLLYMCVVNLPKTA